MEDPIEPTQQAALKRVVLPPLVMGTLALPGMPIGGWGGEGRQILRIQACHYNGLAYDHVICALSGTIAATLVHQAIGDCLLALDCL